MCSPFLPHLKQIVLEQRAFVSHLRELVAWFCFGNQNGRGNLCGFITGAFGACAARRVVSCCPPPCSRSPIPRLCCLRSWRLFSVPFPHNSGMWTSLSITSAQPVPVLEPQGSSFVLLSVKASAYLHQNPQTQPLSILHPTDESTMRPRFRGFVPDFMYI